MSIDTKTDKELLREFAHEIRNPLNALMGYSHLIQGEGGFTPSMEEIHDYAGRINMATKRLLEVCERVLDESIQGRSIVRKQNINFREFCPELIRTFEAEAADKGIKLTHEIVDNFPVMYTDPVMLYEIMANLIGNAIKFTPKGGMVRVKGEVSHKNEALILVVQDTGKGIPSTILRSIMKGEGPTTTFAHSNRRGWGQGMQTILEKAELLGGSLRIESALSGGTVVAVHLPMEVSLKTA